MCSRAVFYLFPATTGQIPPALICVVRIHFIPVSDPYAVVQVSIDRHLRRETRTPLRYV